MLRALFRPAPARLPESLTLLHETGPLRVLLKRSARARRYTLRIKAAEQAAVLTLPPRGTLAAAEDFARRHTGWIAVRLARLPRAMPLAAGAVLPLRGVDHLVEHRPDARGTVWREAHPEGMPCLVVAGAPEHVARRLADFLRREARRDLESAVARHAAALGVTVRRLSIKDTVSRWGSCSAAGNLAFSWRLILAPPAILDYLAAHEVAHRREMNHSARFWALVRQLDPGMDAAEAWLKRHGAGLHRYGA